MNVERGFKRVTLVFSLLAVPLVCFYILVTDSGTPPTPYEFFYVLLFFEILGFVAVWLLFFLMRWLVRGFCSNSQKTTKNNK